MEIDLPLNIAPGKSPFILYSTAEGLLAEPENHTAALQALAAHLKSFPLSLASIYKRGPLVWSVY